MIKIHAIHPGATRALCGVKMSCKSWKNCEHSVYVERFNTFVTTYNEIKCEKCLDLVVVIKPQPVSLDTKFKLNEIYGKSVTDTVPRADLEAAVKIGNSYRRSYREVDREARVQKNRAENVERRANYLSVELRGQKERADRLQENLKLVSADMFALRTDAQVSGRLAREYELKLQRKNETIDFLEKENAKLKKEHQLKVFSDAILINNANHNIHKECEETNARLKKLIGNLRRSLELVQDRNTVLRGEKADLNSELNQFNINLVGLENKNRLLTNTLKNVGKIADSAVGTD